MSAHPTIIRMYFENSGVPATGLTPTITIRDDAGTVVTLNAPVIEIGGGWYFYDPSILLSKEGYSWVCDGGVGLSNVDRYVAGEIPRRTDMIALSDFIVIPEITDVFTIRPSAPLKIERRIWDTAGWLPTWDDATGITLTATDYVWVHFRGSEIIDSSLGNLVVQRTQYYLNLYVEVDLAAEGFLPGDVFQIIFSDFIATIYDKPYRVPQASKTLTLTEKHYAASGFLEAGSTASLLRTDIIAPNGSFDGMQIALTVENAPNQDLLEVRNVLQYIIDGSDGLFYIDRPFVNPVDAGIPVHVTAVKESWFNYTTGLDVQTRLIRALGLAHENIHVVNTEVAGKHTGSVVEVYNTKANALLHDGVSGLLAKYTLTIEYTGTFPTRHVMVKD